MSQGSGKRVKNVCSVLLAIVSYSCPYWMHYFSNEVKRHFDYFDTHVLKVQLVCLLSVSLSNILFSGLADSYGFLAVFTFSVAHCLIPLFIIDNSINIIVLILAYGWFCMATSIFLPAASKLYGTIFTGLPMKVSFCFLAYTNNTAQAMGNMMFFKIYHSFIDLPSFCCMCVPLIFIAAFLVYFTLGKNIESHRDLQEQASLKQVLISKTVHNLAFTLLFLRFTRDFCFEALPSRIIRSSDMSVFFSNFVSETSGLLGSLFIVCFSPRPVDALLQMQFVCAIVSLISSWLVINDVMSGSVIIYLFGLFFDTPEAILSGFMAVQIGEALGNAEAKVTGVVNGIANLGRVLAVVALYNISRIRHISCSIFAGSASLFFLGLFCIKCTAHKVLPK